LNSLLIYLSALGNILSLCLSGFLSDIENLSRRYCLYS